MDRSLLEQPLVVPSPALRPACSPEEAARLRALSPEDYWLAIARELVWTEAPTKALDGSLGDFGTSPAPKATSASTASIADPLTALPSYTNVRTARPRAGRTAV